MKTIRYFLLTLFFFGLLGFLGGCSEKVGYRYGFFTTAILGNFDLESANRSEERIILVQEYHRTFMDIEDGAYRISARLVFPESDGFYRIRWGNDVAKVSLFFIARGFLPEATLFHQSLGIGEIEYKTVLYDDLNWKDNFFLKVQPFLSSFILEPNYQMPARDQLFLGNWLKEAQALLEED